MVCVVVKPFSLVATIILCLQAPFAQTSKSQVSTGVVIDKIVIQSSPDLSYAAYLPTNYAADKAWPIVFCFDPRARGKVAVERFKSAAEKFSYVVVCSNNSRNSLDDDALTKIITAFWQDVHQKFNVDPKRTYGAGFSGGARLASSLAGRCHGCLTGVIATGAGFPANQQPGPQTNFMYFGLVGVDDFNFGEMRVLEKKFSEAPVAYHFETFLGGHEWATAESLEHALAWFTLQAMKASVVAKDERFIDQQLTARVADAESLLASSRFFEAHKFFLSISRDFQDLRDVKSLEAKAAQLQKTSDFRKEEQSDNETVRRQLQEAVEIKMLWLRTPVPDETPVPRQLAIEKLNEWMKKGEAASDTRDRRLARRILSHLFIESIEAANFNSSHEKNYSVAIANLALARAIRPRDANLAYELARAYALDKDKRSALQALEEAVGLGFKDVERLESEGAFSAIAGEARFQKLVSALK